MAVMQTRDTRTFIAGVDLSTHQFQFVNLSSDGRVVIDAAAGGTWLGVLLNDPVTDNAATVAISGKVMVKAGGTIAAGAAVQGVSGEAITAASGDVVMGYALESAVDSQIFAIELIQGGNVVA